MSGPRPFSNRTVPSFKRSKVLHDRFACRTRNRVLIRDQRRVPGGRHFAGELRALKAQLDRRADIGFRARVEDLDLVVAGRVHFDVPGDAILGAAPIDEVRTVRRAGAAFHVAVRQAVAGRQPGAGKLAYSPQDKDARPDRARSAPHRATTPRPPPDARPLRAARQQCSSSVRDRQPCRTERLCRRGDTAACARSPFRSDG